jgi:hypothetical protein
MQCDRDDGVIICIPLSVMKQTIVIPLKRVCNEARLGQGSYTLCTTAEEIVYSLKQLISVIPYQSTEQAANNTGGTETKGGYARHILGAV